MILDRVTEDVRRWYCLLRMRAQNISRFNPKDSKWDAYFRKAAQICLDNGILPRDFIEVQFHVMKPWPEISNIGTKNALRRYIEHKPKYDGRIAMFHNIQVSVFQEHVKVGKTPEEILRSMKELDPLFGFVMATANGLQDIARSLRDDALFRYSVCSYYEKVYGKMLPKDFLEEVDKVRREANASGLGVNTVAAPGEISADD